MDMEQKLYDKLARSPVIAAVKDTNALEAALASPSEIIFLLCGNIFNLQEIVERANRCGKDIYVHVDLIEGFSRDAVSLRYIAEKCILPASSPPKAARSKSLRSSAFLRSRGYSSSIPFPCVPLRKQPGCSPPRRWKSCPASCQKSCVSSAASWKRL